MHLQSVLLTSLCITMAEASAHAAPPAEPAAHAQASPAAPSASAAWTRGEVLKLDLVAGKVSLRHARIENLGMPGMTMVFRVTDPRILKGLKQGDKVRFVAVLDGGGISVSAIERVE